jgi:hypothetical protein
MLKHRRNLTFLARETVLLPQKAMENPMKGRFAPRTRSSSPRLRPRTSTTICDVYNNLYSSIARVYFEFGQPGEGSAFGDVLPRLMQNAQSQATDPR